jgi:hypothetical protein
MQSAQPETDPRGRPPPPEPLEDRGIPVARSVQGTG